MLIKTQAIVLRNMKLGDSSMIVDLLTESEGRLSFVIRIPKTSKAKIRKQFFQPLTVLDIEFDYRPRASLQHISEARIALPFVSIPFSPEKLAISLFIAEFLLYATRGEQGNSRLFSYLVGGIAWLDAATGSFANFHLVFMMRLTLFLGFYPNLDDYRNGMFFDLRNACFTSFMPAHSDVLQPVEAARVITLMRMGFESIHLFRMNRTDRNRIAEIILHYYRLHVPQMPELKSFEVLKEMGVPLAPGGGNGLTG